MHTKFEPNLFSCFDAIWEKPSQNKQKMNKIKQEGLLTAKYAVISCCCLKSQLFIYETRKF